TIGTVAADGLFAGATGIVTNGGNVSITASKTIDVSQAIQAGSGAVTITTLEDVAQEADILLNANVTSSVRVNLDSTDDIVQNPGVGISTPQLLVRAGGGGLNSPTVSLVGDNTITDPTNGFSATAHADSENP